MRDPNTIVDLKLLPELLLFLPKGKVQQWLQPMLLQQVEWVEWVEWVKAITVEWAKKVVAMERRVDIVKAKVVVVRKAPKALRRVPRRVPTKVPTKVDMARVEVIKLLKQKHMVWVKVTVWVWVKQAKMTLLLLPMANQVEWEWVEWVLVPILLEWVEWEWAEWVVKEKLATQLHTREWAKEWAMVARVVTKAGANAQVAKDKESDEVAKMVVTKMVEAKGGLKPTKLGYFL